MITSNKRWRLLAVLAVFAMILAACSPSESTDTTAGEGTPDTTSGEGTPDTTAAPTPDTTEASMTGGTIHGSLGAEPTQIDPQLVSESEGFEAARLLFDGLTLYDPAGGAVIAGAAESWEPNGDNTVWTFHLREGMTFSDGTPVTAQSFVDGFNRLADPDLASPVAYHGGAHGANILGWDDVNLGDGTGEVMDEQVEGLAAVDDLTFQVTLAAPLAFLPKIVAHPAFSPINPDLVTADGYSDMPIGNGPYKMSEPWQHEVSITMERNESYYGEPGNADAIEFQIISDPLTQYQALLDGQIDVVVLGDPALIDQAKTDFADTFTEVPTGVFSYLAYPNATPPYDNPEMRKALTMAVDREAIATRILQRQVANGFVPPVATGGVDGLDTCAACNYDPDQAKAIFDELGGVPGNSLTISFNAGGGHEDWIEAVANDWRNNLGIEVDFNTLEWAAYLEFLGLTGGPPATQPFRLGWQWDYPSAYNFLAPLYHSESTDNYNGYNNPEFDALMTEAATAPTEEAALPALEQAQLLLGEEVPVMPISYGLAQFMWNPTVDNVNYNDFGFFLWEDMTVNG